MILKTFIFRFYRKYQNVNLNQSTGCPRKNVLLEEGRTSAKGTFFQGHLVYDIEVSSIKISN